MKDPRITVLATLELEEALLAADQAMKTSRKPGVRAQNRMLAPLIVQVTSARQDARRAERLARQNPVPDADAEV